MSGRESAAILWSIIRTDTTVRRVGRWDGQYCPLTMIKLSRKGRPLMTLRKNQSERLGRHQRKHLGTLLRNSVVPKYLLVLG